MQTQIDDPWINSLDDPSTTDVADRYFELKAEMPKFYNILVGNGLLFHWVKREMTRTTEGAPLTLMENRVWIGLWSEAKVSNRQFIVTHSQACDVLKSVLAEKHGLNRNGISRATQTIGSLIAKEYIEQIKKGRSNSDTIYVLNGVKLYKGKEEYEKANPNLQ